MDEIIVCDNFLNESELHEATSIIKSGSWKFGHESRNNELIDTPFWNMDLNDNEFFSKTIFEAIQKHFSKKFNLVRVYANGQTFGQNGSYHVDSLNENAYTFVLYLSEIKKEYVETAGGNLYFKMPNEKYNICFEPIFNRGIFFPSKYLHKASSYNRYIMNLRVSASWKMEEIE